MIISSYPIDCHSSTLSFLLIHSLCFMSIVVGKETSSQDCNTINDNLICDKFTTSLHECAVRVLSDTSFPSISWPLGVLKV